MMAKGSKAWYEVYERYIFEIEQEEAEGLKIPERYRLGALCRPWEMNGNLFSKKAGRYSPSRLNITIGSVTLTAWRLVPRRSRHGGSQHVGPEPVAGEALTPDFRK